DLAADIHRGDRAEGAGGGNTHPDVTALNRGGAVFAAATGRIALRPDIAANPCEHQYRDRDEYRSPPLQCTAGDGGFAGVCSHWGGHQSGECRYQRTDSGLVDRPAVFCPAGHSAAEADGRGGALAGLAAQTDRPTDPVTQTTGDGQTHALAVLARDTGAVERSERLGQGRRIHADAAVVDFDGGRRQPDLDPPVRGEMRSITEQ